MRKQENFSPPAVGGSSLLVIFAVLCLTVFALLSLSSVLAERRLADAAVASVTDYYEADLKAEEIFARLRRGEAVDGIREEKGIYEYAVSISSRLTLMVRLQKTDEKWDVLLWQTVTADNQPEDVLNVWKGSEDQS